MSRGKACIFILEDNPINLKLVRDILDFHSYEVLEAIDGQEGLKKITDNYSKIDLILLDLQLPSIGGIEVIHKLKENQKTKDIPIIVVSAHAMESDIKASKEAGCNHYITKPINIPDFLSRIEDVLTLNTSS